MNVPVCSKWLDWAIVPLRGRRRRHRNVIDGRVHVLVVDDSSDERAMFRAWFEMDGRFGDILEAGDGGDAIMLARLHPDIDAVLLDHEMPGRSGLDCLVLLHELLPDARIVMYTGHRDVVGLATELGADAVYDKGTPLRIVAQGLASIDA